MLPVNRDPMELLLHFVRERELIRQRKEAGQPAPWTEDEILGKYRFCNVRRRDDRVSRWLLEHYYPTFKNTFASTDIWFTAAIARLINWPPTLDYLVMRTTLSAAIFEPEHFAATLEAFHKQGAKTYTGAYMLYAGGMNPKYKGIIKSDFIAHNVLTDLIKHADELRGAIANKSVRGFTEALSKCFSFSSFMAGQIAADLTYLPGQLAEAMDLYTYAPQGPGSVRGLNRLTGAPLNMAWKDDYAFQSSLASLLHNINAAVGGAPVTLHDVQNCLCEYDKYMRVLNGEGKPRSQYRPETAY